MSLYLEPTDKGTEGGSKDTGIDEETYGRNQYKLYQLSWNFSDQALFKQNGWSVFISGGNAI